jgi:single-stranded DNA-binding protein
MAYPSSTNNVTLIGRVTRDLEIRRVGEGKRPMLVLGVAVRKPRQADQ